MDMFSFILIMIIIVQDYMYELGRDDEPQERNVDITEHSPPTYVNTCT